MKDLEFIAGKERAGISNVLMANSGPSVVFTSLLPHSYVMNVINFVFLEGISSLHSRARLEPIFLTSFIYK